MNTPAIGPSIMSTLVSRDARASAKLWCDYLYQHISGEYTLSQEQANNWQSPQLVGCNVITLANQVNESWLQIVDAPDAVQGIPFQSYGWLSLEISVEDVDALYQEIKDSPLEIIGEPANLDVSDDIRAMQVVGLDGEVLYLTQIKAPVPPFELPDTRCPVDRLFIPVAMVPDRDKAANVFEQFEHTSALKFDTKITVINKALGNQIDQRHPVATVQLAGNNLVELDQISGLHEPASSALTTGIRMISFGVEKLPNGIESYATNTQSSACIIRGDGGKLMELVAT